MSEQPHSTKIGIVSELLGVNVIYPLENFRELVAYDFIHKIEGTKNWFLGLISLRGKLIAVNDLALYFSEKDNTTPTNYNASKILVVEHDAEYFGFTVDKNSVNAYFKLDSEDKQPTIDAMSSNYSLPIPSSYVKGILISCYKTSKLNKDDLLYENCIVLDLHSLVNDEKFIHI